MGHHREYDIAFVGLKPGLHEFEYHVQDSFFEKYQQQDFTNCNATVKLTLDKENGFMLLKFEIGGTLDLVCDRCGNPLVIDLWDEFKMVVKLVDNPDEMNSNEEDPEVFYISRTESHLHVADWIYEFVNLAIPMQKTCGDDEGGNTKCNQEVLKMLRNMEAHDKESSQNPLWKGLEKFKDLDN